MSLNPLRRAIFAALVLSLSFASLPVQAWNPVRERHPAVADLGEGAGFLGKLFDLLARRWWGEGREGMSTVREKEGMSIDPDGTNAGNGDEGVLIDPDGAN